MRIVDIIPHVLTSDLNEPFAFSQGWVYQRSSVIVEVVTDEGIVGWGESLCHGLQPPEIAAAFIQFKFKPLLLGRDVFDVEVLWEEMYNSTRPFGQAGAAVNAISGVDIALWDAIGRKLSLPINKLLGGSFRQTVRPYATGFYRTPSGVYPQDTVDEAKRHIRKGFGALKLKIGFGLDKDLETIYSVRQAVGPSIEILVDTNCAYNVAYARRLLLESQEAKLYLMEEPLAPEDLEGYKNLRHLTSTYIAAGENIFGKWGYRQWIAEGALDILQPDLCSSGGFTECKKIAAMAQAYNTMVIPHVWGSGIGLAASLQFISTLPPTPLSLHPHEIWLEYDQSEHPFRSDLVNHEIVMADGLVNVPQNPGIGVNVNRDVIEEYGRNRFA